MSMERSEPQDMSESPVMAVEADGYQALPLGELAVAVARYKIKAFYHHAEAAEAILWDRAFAEARGT